MLIMLIVVLKYFLTVARCVGSYRLFAAGRPTRPIQIPAWPGLDPRRCLSPRDRPRYSLPTSGGVAGHGRRLGVSADGTSWHVAESRRCGGGALDRASPRLGLSSTASDSISIHRGRFRGWHAGHGSRQRPYSISTAIWSGDSRRPLLLAGTIFVSMLQRRNDKPSYNPYFGCCIVFFAGGSRGCGGRYG